MAYQKGFKNRLKNHQNHTEKSVRFNSCIYRLNVSYLSGFGTYSVPPKGTKRLLNISPKLDQLKSDVLQLLLFHQRPRDLRYYTIAWQTHPGTGQPHLDILLVYDKNVKKSPSSYNYLLPLCPQRQSPTTPGVFITGYSKNKLNKAILEYGSKEDPIPLSTLPTDLSSYLNIKQLQKDPYAYLEDQMLKDPLHFNLEQYVRIHNLARHIKGWSGLKTKLKDMQVAAANLQLKNKPGFKLITRNHIEEKLSAKELEQFDSWTGYQTIVNYLNQVPLLGNKRPMKTLNLLITGSASIGKTSLFHNPHHGLDQVCVEDFCSVYPMGMSTWFPKYQSNVYNLILWNEAKLTSYSYDTILKLLEGSYLDLPTKGGVAPKRDNPLIVMTSNLTLEQMIVQKFGYNKSYCQMARKNLAVRVQNVIVPNGYNLFILQKLLI